jgi:lipopolysaccharide transport system ATP-binding protein
MYVRLAFAVAAHLEPEILIVDEVLAVGDAEFQRKCLGKMSEVATGGRTVLFVSHNMAAVQQLCQRCVLLSGGSIAVDGSCRDVTSIYLTDASVCGNGHVDLRNHPARSKSSTAIISELVMRNGSGEATSCVLTHDTLVIDITIEPIATINEPRVALAIEDSYGRRLMTMASYFDRMPFPRIETKSIARCEFGPLCLGPGRYLLSVSIGAKSIGLIDSIDEAIWFDVEWDNHYPNSEPYNDVYGPVLRESVWRSMT